MTPDEHDDLLDPQRPPREGIFDAQLSFPAPFAEAPRAPASIVKRDGATVPYEHGKITEAIFRAAKSIGGEDRDLARNLASAVTLYLTKSLDGQVPTVDQVHDAVERVLTEMGHMRTALAYVRYRDRRGRVRLLRQRASQDMAGELAEAPRHSQAAEPGSEGFLFLRTSDETLTHWNRDRIVQALVRETGLDREKAGRIASEVEGQVRAAAVETLTASLVRELVGAKLIEHGLEEYWQRHTRLGVPLYDAERIICSPHDGDAAYVHDPESTNGLLAEQVKKEFGLTRVFSPKAAEAHVLGEFHLHELGRIDRLESLTLPLEAVKRSRMGAGGQSPLARAPLARGPDSLVAQMAGATMALWRHFTGPVTWDAVNFFFAPYVQALDRDGLRDVARVLVYEFAFHSLPRGGGPRPQVELTLCWDLPAYLCGVEAVGPGGAYTGLSYDEYRHTAQQLAWEILEVYKEGGEQRDSIPLPLPVVAMTPEFFRSPGHEAFLEHASGVAALSGPIRFSFDREAPILPHTAELYGPRQSLAHRITLNLPRAAYRTRNEKALEGELTRLADLAALAHLEKKAFIRRLMAQKNAGPLALLAAQRDGAPFFPLEQSLFVLGVMGLNECVQYITGQELHESDNAMALAEGILSRLLSRCTEWSDDEGIHLALAPDTDPVLSRRFAMLDLEYCGEPARQTVKTGPSAADVCYTPGIELSARGLLSPMERLRLESRFHPFLGHGATTRLPAPGPSMSASSIANLIGKAFHQTPCRGIAFGQ